MPRTAEEARNLGARFVCSASQGHVAQSHGTGPPWSVAPRFLVWGRGRLTVYGCH